MSSSNISTNRHSICGSCQECPCHQRESDNPHYAPHRTPVPGYLIRNQRARRYPGRHHFNDSYQPAEDSYPRAEYSTGVHLGSGSSSRGLGENYYPEASDIYAEYNSPSTVGYTFYSEDTDLEESLEESPLDYPEPSTIHSEANSPSILTFDYSSGTLDQEELPLDLATHYPQASGLHSGPTNSPGCLGRNYNPEELNLHHTFDLVTEKFPATFATIRSPHAAGYPEALDYLRCTTAFLDPPTRSNNPRDSSPAARDDPFYYLSARSRRWNGDSTYYRDRRGEDSTGQGVRPGARQEGGESSNTEEEPAAYEYPSSGARGDALGYYPPSGHVPRYH